MEFIPRAAIGAATVAAAIAPDTDRPVAQAQLTAHQRTIRDIGIAAVAAALALVEDGLAHSTLVSAAETVPLARAA